MRIRYENTWKDYRCFLIFPTVAIDASDDSNSIGFFWLWFAIALDFGS